MRLRATRSAALNTGAGIYIPSAPAVSDLFDIATLTATNLTDAATPSFTRTKVGESLSLALSTGSRLFAFSTTGAVSAGKTEIKYRAECTFASTCGAGFGMKAGVDMWAVYVTQRGRVVLYNSRGGSANIALNLGALTTGAVIEIRAVVDKPLETASIFVSINGGAPYSYTLTNVPCGDVTVVQINASTVVHSISTQDIGASGDIPVGESAFTVAKSVAGATLRSSPAGWTYTLPTPFSFYKAATEYLSAVDLKPGLSEAQKEVNVLYVDVATGSDSNPGTSALPLRGLKAAASRVGLNSKAIIKAKGGLYSYDFAFGGQVDGAVVQVVSWDGLPVISSRHDASLTWTLGTSATYSATFTNGVSGVVDASLQTADGDHSRVVLQTSLANCQATPGSYYITGTTIYVHTFDGRSPDASVRVYKKAASGTGDDYGFRGIEDGQVVYMEGISLEGGVAPLSLDSRVSTHTRKTYLKNCSFKYGVGANGVNLTSAGLIVSQNCIAAWSSQDGFNYKASGFGGYAPLAIEIDCIGRYNGFDAQGTNNGSTMHSGGSVIRVNGDYHHNQNRSIHDIDNCFSWNMGVISRDSTGATFPYCFVCGIAGGTDASKMWLDGCTASGGTQDVVSAEATTTVYVSGMNSAGRDIAIGPILAYTP